jgi:hypothetical protein
MSGVNGAELASSLAEFTGGHVPSQVCAVHPHQAAISISRAHRSIAHSFAGYTKAADHLLSTPTRTNASPYLNDRERQWITREERPLNWAAKEAQNVQNAFWCTQRSLAH